MNLNATLLGQMIVFALFVWFTMVYVWPPMVAALEQRRQKIAEGLAAAEQGRKALDTAQEQVNAQLRAVQEKAQHVLNQTQAQATQTVEAAAQQARDEASRILTLAQEQIALEAEQAKAALRQHVVELTMLAATKLLQRQVPDLNEQLVNQLIEEG